MRSLSLIQTKILFCWLLCTYLPAAFSFAAFNPRNNRSTMPPETGNVETRRRWLSDGLTFLGTCTALLPTNPAYASIIKNPLPESTVTVILESPSSRLGIQLMDVAIGNKVVAAVKSTEPRGLGATNGVEEGMIAIGHEETSREIVHQIKNGPYPIMLQFYSLARETGASTAKEGLEKYQTFQGKSQGEPALSTKGAGLGITTIRMGDDCKLKVRRGDTVKVRYVAKVASSGGPIYDSTEDRGGPITFTMGDRKAISGVEIGMGDMCVGEVRDLDIPAGLGYGRFGSEYYDIPGDVRLWWRIELVELKPGDMKFR